MKKKNYFGIINFFALLCSVVTVVLILAAIFKKSSGVTIAMITLSATISVLLYLFGRIDKWCDPEELTVGIVISYVFEIIFGYISGFTAITAIFRLFDPNSLSFVPGNIIALLIVAVVAFIVAFLIGYLRNDVD